jgi:hypothetical protein
LTKREAFFHFLQPGYLYAAAIFFAVLTAILIALIYFYLYIKKRNFRVVERINEQINSWIGEILMEKELPDIILTPELQQYLQKKKNREFVIDNLIRIRKNLTGAASKSIVDLYHRLGLKKDSMERFYSIVWHHKARGIYELYMMDQEQELPDIYKYTNSDNEYVRMEAQIAIVGFWGFEGLTFLDTLEHPLHDWQQLKLLEQLSTLDIGPMDNLPLWLRSENEYVVHFALKLADIYRRMEVHDIVVESLQNENERIRFQAIKTLGKIAGDDTNRILTGRYEHETYDNKKNILKQLRFTGTEDCIPFLDTALTEDDDFLKLEAARALAAISNTPDILNKYSEDPTLLSITKQIRYELHK